MWVHVVLFLVTLIYAVTFSIAKDVMPHYLGSHAFVSIRILGAWLLFLLLSLLEKPGSESGKKTRLEQKDLIKAFTASVFGVAFNMLFFFKGLSLTTPINASVLMLNTPVFVAIIAWVMGKEKMTPARITGIILAGLGAGLLMTGRGFALSSDTLSGDIYITINAILYAFYLVYVRRLLTKYTVVTVSKWTFFFGLIMVAPLSIGELQLVSWATFPSYIWGEIVFVVVGTTFLAYLLNAWAIEKAGPVVVGSYIYLQPLLAGLIAVLLARDTFDVTKVMATLLIFTGVYLTGKRKT